MLFLSTLKNVLIVWFSQGSTKIVLQVCCIAALKVRVLQPFYSPLIVNLFFLAYLIKNLCSLMDLLINLLQESLS